MRPCNTPRPRGGHRSPLHILLLVSALTIAWLLFPTPSVNAREVRMFPESGTLEPGGTLEFRFPEALVTPDQLGPTNELPVVFTPPMDGVFTWLSTRSGVFAPTQAIPLGSHYNVSLRPDIKIPSGAAAKWGFSKKLATPDFGVVSKNSNVWDPKNVPPKAEVRLGFNLPVVADAEAFHFVDAGGRSVAATVRHAISGDYFETTPESEDWNLRWQLTLDPSKVLAPGSDEVTTSRNRLVIEPVEALPAGKGWRLEVRAGLTALAGDQFLAKPLSLPLGEVPPFGLTTLEPGNFIHSGCTLFLTFSDEPAPDITPESAPRFFRFEPPVPELSWESNANQLTVRGKFELGRDYRLRVGDEVYSSSGLPFTGPRERTFRFAPVPPRIYLPDLTISQIPGGLRQLPVRSVNLQSLRIKATLVPPDSAAQALALFKANEWKYADGERIPVDEIPGRVLCDETIALPDPALDQSQMTPLDWNKILGGQKAGVISLTLEGTPLASAPSQSPAAQALIQLSDLGILWKKAGDSLQVSVFSLATAAPVARAQARLLDANFLPIVSSETNAEGNADLNYRAVPAWLEVRSGDDVHVLKMGPEAQTLRSRNWAFSNWDVGNAVPASVRTMIFCDRPLYQPAETVHVKGFMRRIEPTGLTRAPQLAATLVLRGPDYQEILRVPVTTDSEGAFDTSLSIPAGALGNHTLQLDLGDDHANTSTSFLVAEYQPDSFEVDLALPKKFPADAHEVVANLTGTYFFGGALHDADVRWTLRQQQTGFEPPGFSGFEFLGANGIERGAKPVTLRGEGRLTAAEPLAIRPVLPLPTLAPFQGILTAEVTDINQQTVSRKAEFTREASEFYLGIARPDPRVVALGDNVPLSVIAVRPDGIPLEEAREVTVGVWRWRYNIVRVKGAGGAMTFRRETIEEPLLEQKARTIVPHLVEGEWRLGETASLDFKTTALGHHRVRVSAKDAAGREVASESSFYVSGEGTTVWDYENPAEIKLVADKDSYSPGETARILVQTPISGEAHVTIERGNEILRTLRVPLEGNAPTLGIPILEGDAPNLSVSLVLLRGGDQSTRKFPAPDFRHGSCQLSIDDPSAHLKVDAKPLQSSVQPGDAVETLITVRDHSGKPVANAGVTFYAVDDGILALTGFARPDPAAVFFAPFSLRVLTGLSLEHLMGEDPNDLEFSNKGYLIGGGGEGGPLIKLRENFPGTACWLPSLYTDADGRVTATFTAPDALTRYRLVAVASAGERSFGSAESAITISRPLMLMPGLGQFANTGDRLSARAVVRNGTGKDGKIEVRMQVGDSVQTATLDVPNGASRAADFPLVIGAPGTVEILWSATMQGFSDRVRTLLPVHSPMLRLNETSFSQLDAAINNLFEDVNPQIAEGRGEATLTLANTRLASLRENVRHLVEYPYGCLEQTVSSLVPWTVMPTMAPVIPDFARDPETIQRIIDETTARIFKFQTHGGGLAFWQGGNSPSPFASAWAAVVLSRTIDRQKQPPAPWRQLLAYLAKNLRGLTAGEATERLSERVLTAYALSLAGQPEPAYHEELYRRRADLPPGSRALLALAILQSNGPREMAAALLETDSQAPADFSPFSNPARERAIRLLAWTSFQPDAKEVAVLSAELLAFGQKSQPGTTQDNAWGLLAFENYFTQVEQPNPAKSAVQGLIRAGAESVTFAVDAHTPATTRTFPITPGSTLEVENPEQGPLYGETRFAVHPPLGAQPRQDRGFSVSRSYRKIAPDGSLESTENLRVGDRVVVTIRIETNRPSHFVAVDDPLPAILEAVNPDFQTREAADQPSVAAGSPVSHRETRADRVLYFCDELPPGAFTFTCLTRVRMAGEASAGATKVEAMYRPERFGLGEIQTLTSQPANP